MPGFNCAPRYPPWWLEGFGQLTLPGKHMAMVSAQTFVDLLKHLDVEYQCLPRAQRPKGAQDHAV